MLERFTPFDGWIVLAKRRWLEVVLLVGQVGNGIKLGTEIPQNVRKVHVVRVDVPSSVSVMVPCCLVRWQVVCWRVGASIWWCGRVWM